MGRIQPHLFPKIFGVNENESLDFEGTKLAFEKLTNEINESLSNSNTIYTVDEVAYGFIRIANEAMVTLICMKYFY